MAYNSGETNDIQDKKLADVVNDKKTSVTKNQTRPEAKNTFATIMQLWPYLWPQHRLDLKRRAVIAVSLLVLAKIIGMLSPFVYKWLIDSLDKTTLSQYTSVIIWLPLLLAAGYALVRITEDAINQLRDGIFASVGQNAVKRLAYETFRHLHELSLSFHLSRQTGALSRIIERASRGIETVVRFTLLSGIPAIIEFIIISIIFFFYLGGFFFLTMALTVVLYIWFTVKASNWRIGIRRRLNNADNDANTKIVDSLLNYETVKYFNNEPLELNRFNTSISNYEQAGTRLWVSLAWLNFGQSLIFWTGTGICLVMAAQQVVNGVYTAGDLVLIIGFFMKIYQPLSFIGFVYREIRQGLVDIESMFELLQQKSEIKDIPGARPLTINKASITFENVHFGYNKSRDIIKGISFTVPANKSVALVGPSGAGKSTISKIFFRFYDIESGRILIDGQDIKDVTIASLHQAIGIVPQDTVLFNDTIGYNIAYGRPDAGIDEVRQAAKMAAIDTFINNLPDGYDTMVGERGLKLSGGEKQRVAIARTILKSPPILVLDEATSALDSNTEKEIQNALDAIAANRTSLIIAHRLSTVVNVDQILVLENGQIKERGTHNELLAQNGRYFEMWQRQLQNKVTSDPE